MTSPHPMIGPSVQSNEFNMLLEYCCSWDDTFDSLCHIWTQLVVFKVEIVPCTVNCWMDYFSSDLPGGWDGVCNGFTESGYILSCIPWLSVDRYPTNWHCVFKEAILCSCMVAMVAQVFFQSEEEAIFCGWVASLDLIINETSCLALRYRGIPLL